MPVVNYKQKTKLTTDKTANSCCYHAHSDRQIFNVQLENAQCNALGRQLESRPQASAADRHQHADQDLHVDGFSLLVASLISLEKSRSAGLQMPVSYC